jgi:hypothetical protein
MSPLRILPFLSGSLVLACTTNGHKKELSGADCITDALESVSSCFGRNEGFTECLYYWRATGRPRRTVCELLIARKNLSDPTAHGKCGSMSDLVEVPCERYAMPTTLRCYACTSHGVEAVRTKVYAFSPDCGVGWEQATCNFDPANVTSAIGR